MNAVADVAQRVNRTADDVRSDPRVQPALDGTTICPLCYRPCPEPSRATLGVVFSVEQEGLPRLPIHCACAHGLNPLILEQVYVGIFTPLIRAAERRSHYS